MTPERKSAAGQATDAVQGSPACRENRSPAHAPVIAYEHYPNAKKTTGSAVQESWSDFIGRLEKPVIVPVEHDWIDDKDKLDAIKAQRLPLWRFVSGGGNAPSRSKDNPTPIDEVNALVFDCDGDHDEIEIHSKLARFTHCGYTTFKHTFKGQRRFRVILPLSRPIAPEHYGDLWDTVAEYLGGMKDTTAREYTRGFFAPGVPAPFKKDYSGWHQAGALLYPDDWPPRAKSNQRANGIPGKPASVPEEMEGNIDTAPVAHEASRAKVLAALACVWADDYDAWVRMGMALSRTGWSDALEQWLNWSQTTRRGNYNVDAARAKWPSFNDTHEPKVTAGTIIHSARESGFDSENQPKHPAAAYWRARREGKTPNAARAAAQAMNATLGIGGGGPLTHGALEGAYARIEEWLAEGAAQLPDWLREINRTWFQAPEGREVFVWRWMRSELGYDVLQPMRQDAFVKLLAGDNIEAAAGQRPPVSKAKVWLNDPRRRKYDAIQFLPGVATPESVYNLWRGFGVQPKQGDWSLMLDHIVDGLCNGNRKYAAYFVRHLAWCVQNPDKQPEVAIVLRGKRGTGKGIFANWLLRIWGTHGIAVASADKFTGRFNGHLRDKCFLFLDEAFWAGNKEAEGLLKQYITEPVIASERKRIDVESARNYLRMVLASNEHWIVPSGIDERRFFALAVSDARAQDKAHFAAIQKQANEEGGVEAMLHDLLALDLKGWHPRDVPQTDELARQKERSLSPTHSWYLERLRTGKLHEFDQGWVPLQAREQVVASITQWARKSNARAYVAQSTQVIGGELAEVCPSLGRGRNLKCSKNGQQVNAWRFPDLQTACTEFEQATGIRV